MRSVRGKDRMTFRTWPIRLMAISFVVFLVTVVLASISSLFICIAFGLGSLDSLSTMEELTGGRELSLVRVPVILVADFVLHAIAVGPTTIAQDVLLYIQFVAVIVLTESVIIFLLRLGLRSFVPPNGE